MILKGGLIGGLAVVMALPALGKIDMGTPFSDGMVLQREMEVPVWGTAEPGRTVTVAFADAEVKTSVGVDGKWVVKLPSMAASSESRKMTVTESESGWFGSTVDEVVVNDILVGEVWFCAGQSNTEVPLWNGNMHYCDSNGGLRGRMTCKPLVRYCKQANYKVALKPLTKSQTSVSWKPFVPENLGAGSFSAMGVYFALELHNALGVPVGIVGSYWGGTSIIAWTPRIGLEGVAFMKPWADCRLMDYGEYRTAKAAADAKGVKWFPAYHGQPTVLWNAQVAPWTPMAMRGFIWYQGCSDNGFGHKYAQMMHALYDGWTKEFRNPKLSICFVQLAPWWNGGNGCPAVQEGQSIFAAEEPNAHMAVVCDRGCLTDIHPNDKATVGLRLAALALEHDYGFKGIGSDAPTLKNWKIEGDRFVLSFDNAESWRLYNQDWSHTNGFEIAGTDGKWFAAEIDNVLVKDTKPYVSTGLIKGAELIVRADGVKEPKRLRYLHSEPWKGNLFNEVGLPLGVFHIGD